MLKISGGLSCGVRIEGTGSPLEPKGSNYNRDEKTKEAL
jgi:hypothetical protein